MTNPRSLTLACALVIMSGCSDDDDASGPIDSTRNGGVTMEENPATVYEQPAPWQAMTTEQRFEFMKRVVVPEMTSVFQKVNPSAEVKCGTCHGTNPGAVDFKMPNGLAPLNLADFPLEESDDPKIAASARFMREEVMPAMAALLEVDLRSQENPGGFGCFACHARDEDG